jgi:hypothetical protein
MIETRCWRRNISICNCLVMTPCCFSWALCRLILRPCCLIRLPNFVSRSLLRELCFLISLPICSCLSPCCESRPSNFSSAWQSRSTRGWAARFTCVAEFRPDVTIMYDVLDVGEHRLTNGLAQPLSTTNRWVWRTSNCGYRLSIYHQGSVSHAVWVRPSSRYMYSCIHACTHSRCRPAALRHAMMVREIAEV